jgi:hypothetical protein
VIAGSPAVRLQFVTEPGLGAWLIRWYGGLHLFSHVDAVLPDGRLLGARSDCVGGQPPGVQIRPPGYLKFSRVAAVQLPCTQAQREAYYQALTSQLGKPYSEEAILGFALGRDLKDRRGRFCSGLQLWALGKSRVLSRNVAEYADVATPDDLYLVVRAVADDRRAKASGAS